jgi:hypothetical protein
MEHAETISQGLKRLENDYTKWTAKHGEMELADLLESVKGVEIDLSLMVTDYISAGCQVKEDTKIVFDDFHKIFVCLDALFCDLKKARSALKEAYYISRNTFCHLEIDCERFMKNIQQIQAHLS